MFKSLALDPSTLESEYEYITTYFGNLFSDKSKLRRSSVLVLPDLVKHILANRVMRLHLFEVPDACKYYNQLDIGRALALTAQNYGNTPEDLSLGLTYERSYDKFGLYAEERKIVLDLGRQEMLGLKRQGIPEEYFKSYAYEEDPATISTMRKLFQKYPFCDIRNVFQAIQKDPTVDPGDLAHLALRIARWDWLGKGIDSPDFIGAFDTFRYIAAGTSYKARPADKARALLYYSTMKKNMQGPRPNFFPRDRLTVREIQNIQSGFQTVIDDDDAFLQDRLVAKYELETLQLSPSVAR